VNKRQVLRHSLAVGLTAGLTIAGGTATAANNKGSIDVLNWWTSGSEAKSMHVLQKMMANEGYKMNDDAVAGGGGANARTVLKSRVQSHNIPGAAQIKGPAIQQWCKTGLTGNINKVAKSDHWNKVLAPVFVKDIKCNGNWIAVPFDDHRINWLWINRAVMKKAGAKMPHSWNDLVADLKKIKAAGIIPIAGGGDTWGVATELDALAAATGGPEFYRKAFVKLDSSTLSGPTMVKTFKRLRTIEKYTNPNGTGLTWNHNTRMVVKGKAAMQIMGDWAKGEITIDGDTPGKQIACIAVPGSKNSFIYNIDSFVVFKTSSASTEAAQKAFARTAMSPKFQRRFNMAKGAIPAREGVSLKGFDACAHKSEKAYQRAKAHHGLVPSMSQNQADNNAVTGAIFDVIAQFYNHPSMTPQAAAKALAQQVKSAEAMSRL
jgi:glucose/mannose transport system substrate-binding protein